MAEGANYHLGITISATDGGVSAELKKIEDRFKKVANTISQSTSKINKSLQGSNQAIENHAKQYNNLNAKLNKIETAQSKQLNQVKKSESNVKKQTSAMEKKEKQVKKNTRATNQNTTATENWLSSNTRSLGIAIRSTVVWAAATTAIYGTQRALKNVHNTMMEVNAEMIALQRVMNPAVTNFKELRNVAGDLGVEYASNIQDIVSSMVEWGRQGRNQIETIELTEAALLATNVAQMDSKESVELLTAALLQFNLDASESTAIIDRWNEVANNFAITASDIGIALRESGSAARAAGISMDELIGMTTALSAATAKSGSRIGRSLRTTFSRLMGDAGATEESLGKVEVALNSVGIALRQDKNTYRSMTDVLTDLATEWSGLDEVMRANIARAIGGRRRYSDVIALVENWDLALDATTSSMNSLNSAIEENEKYLQGMEANWKQVRAEFNQIINTFTDLGSEDLSIGLAKILQGALRSIDNFIVGIVELQDILKSIGKGIIGGAGLVFALKTLGVTVVSTSSALSAFTVTTGTLALGFNTLLASINPLIPLLGLATIELSKYITKQGELAKINTNAKDRQEELNKSIERANELSKTEMSNTEDLIKTNKELLTQYDKLIDARDTYFDSDRMGGGLVNTLKSFVGDINPFSTGAFNEYDAVADKINETITELRISFPELSAQFKDQEEFVNAAYKELTKYENTLQNSVASIDKYTNRMIESTKQGVREVQMLESKADRYFELYNIQNKTFEQESEMLSIQSELQKSFYELGAAGSQFNSELKELVDDRLAEFGAEGTKVDETIKQLEQDLNLLSKSQESLSNSYQTVGSDLDENYQKYLKLVDAGKENTKQGRVLSETIEKQKVRYESIGESLDKVTELTNKFNFELKVLRDGFDSLSEQELLTNLAGAVDILNEFNEEVKEANIKINNMRKNLEEELDFQSWLGGKLDRTPLEQLEADISVYEGKVKEVTEIAEGIFQLDPQNLKTKTDIDNFLEQEFGIPIENLKEKIDVSKIYDVWDSNEFEKLQSVIIENAGKLITDFNETIITKQEKYDLGSRIKDIMSIEGLYDGDMIDYETLFDLPEDKLNEITGIFAKIKGRGENLGEGLDGLVAKFNSLGLAAESALILKEEKSDLEKWVEDYNKQVEKNKEIEALISEYEVSQVGLYSDELKNVNEDLRVLNEAQKETTDSNVIKRIQTQIDLLEEEKEIFKELNQMGELDIVKQFENFDISDVSSIEEAERQLAKLTIGLENFKGKFSDLSEEEMQKVVSMVGLDEDTIQKVFDKIREEIEDLEDSWYDTMAGAIGNALEQFDSSMSFTDKLSILIREGFSEAFKNLPEEEIQSQLTKVGSWLGDSLNLGDQFGEMFGDFATQAGKVFGAGGSVGQSFATGIGTVLTDSTQIGSIIGSLGQSIFGGVEGRKEMQAAKEINEQVLNTQSTLQEFGIFYDAQLATFEDKAGFLQSAFGGEDWDVKGLSKAKIDLEEMEEIIERVGRTAQDIFGKLPSLLSEGLSYSDFRSSFEDTVGQAMQDAVINKLLETQAIEGQIKQLAGMVEMAIGDAGQIDYAQLEAAQDYADDIMKRAAMINDVVKGLDLTGNNFQPDVTMDRTFRAGSTSAITYNNTFAVNSQIFLDDTAAAREAAKKLAPYIKEWLDRR